MITWHQECGGQLHTCSLTDQGAYVLHDHPLKAEQVLWQMGGDPPPCVEGFLAYVGLLEPGKVPAPVYPAFQMNRALKARRMEKWWDPLAQEGRYRKFSLQLLTPLVEQCLREGAYPYQVPLHLVPLVMSGVLPGGDTLLLPLARDWYRAVYKEGQALQNGLLVLGYQEGEPLVLSCHAGRWTVGRADAP